MALVLQMSAAHLLDFAARLQSFATRLIVNSTMGRHVMRTRFHPEPIHQASSEIRLAVYFMVQLASMTVLKKGTWL